MTSDLLVKGLLRQAGISVLAGLLLSSAALAEDNSGAAGETGEVSIGIDDGGPEVAVDPAIDGEDSGAIDGEEGDGDTGGDDTGSEDDGSGDGTDAGGEDDGAGDDSGIGEDDGGVPGEDGVDLGGEDGLVSIDDTCANCNTMADGSGETVDVVAEFGVTAVQRDVVTGGGVDGSTGGPAGGRDVSRDAGDAGRGAGRDGDLGAHRLLIVK